MNTEDGTSTLGLRMVLSAYVAIGFMLVTGLCTANDPKISGLVPQLSIAYNGNYPLGYWILLGGSVLGAILFWFLSRNYLMHRAGLRGLLIFSVVVAVSLLSLINFGFNLYLITAFCAFGFIAGCVELLQAYKIDKSFLESPASDAWRMKRFELVYNKWQSSMSYLIMFVIAIMGTGVISMSVGLPNVYDKETASRMLTGIFALIIYGGSGFIWIVWVIYRKLEDLERSIANPQDNKPTSVKNK